MGLSARDSRVYDSRGWHIGEFDPVTGEQKKGPNPLYRVEP
jgi:hypothetical protein